MALTMPQRTGKWTADPGFGVYVHIPFCRHRCHYCDFNTYEGLDGLFVPYVDALVTEIGRHLGSDRPATSVFFGGGTPTLLPASELGRILRAIEDALGLAPGVEITVEANPETVDTATFEELLAAGFNRVSIGVQSTSERVLQALGRTHTSERALGAVEEAHAAGFADVNVDLIYGSQWETNDHWRQSLTDVISAGPEHVSAYALTVEEGTPLGTFVATGRIADVDPDVQAERHALAEELLGAAGYDRYEISNWSLPGHACRHNLLYWCAGDYLGFGAGAHGHRGGCRFWNVRLPRDLIARIDEGVSTVEGAEELDDDPRVGEALMLGLRLKSGIHEPSFVERFGRAAWDARAATIEHLVRQGQLVRQDDYLALSPRATMVANDVCARLL